MARPEAAPRRSSGSPERLLLHGALLLALGLASGRPAAAEPPSLVPGLTLPRVGTLGDLPPEADRVLVVLDRDGHLRVKGADLDLGGLSALLGKMRSAPGRLEPDGANGWNVVLAVDSLVPWGAVSWVMQAAADARARVYRTFFLALPEAGSEEGAMAIFLRKDRGLGGHAFARPSPRVRIHMAGPTASAPSALAAALRARPEGVVGARVRLEVAPHAPAGYVLRVVDAIFRAGAAGVDFEGIPVPQGPDPIGRLVAAAAANPWQPSLALDRVEIPGDPGPALPARERVRGGYAGDAADPAASGFVEDVLEEAPAVEKEPPPVVEGPLPLGPVSTPMCFPRRRPENARSEEAPARAAVERALAWLAAHQSPDGRFEAAGWTEWCDGKPPRAPGAARPEGVGKPEYDVGTTGLALLAFLGNGYTNRSDHPYAKAVARGLRALKNLQDPEGCFGPRTPQHYIYNHATAALAMVEAYAMTESPIFKGAAQRALDFIAIARNPYFAWRYGVKPGDNDTSVTGWLATVLLTAHALNVHVMARGNPAPLTIDGEAFEGARAWLDKMTDPETGRVGYVQRGTGPARSLEMVDRFPLGRSESMTAVGVYLRLLLPSPGDAPQGHPAVAKGLGLLRALPPVWNEADGSIDLPYWLYGSLAAFHAGPESWTPWADALHRALLSHQRTDGDSCTYAGSFDPVDPWGPDGGRVYATALAALALQTPWRALPTAAP